MKDQIGKAKKSVRLMMEKLFGMELELILVKTINGEVQLHALVDGKKIIINESTVRRDLQLDDVEVFVNQQLDGLPSHNRIYDASSHTKKIFGNIKRVGKGSLWSSKTLFPTMVVQNQQELGEGSAIPTDSYHTPTIIKSSTQPQKTQKPRKPKRKDTQLVKAANTAYTFEAESRIVVTSKTKTRSKGKTNEAGSQ
ncbi:hypothetical protein Tco_1450233 [Tanacetum coccineum]